MKAAILTSLCLLASAPSFSEISFKRSYIYQQNSSVPESVSVGDTKISFKYDTQGRLVHIAYSEGYYLAYTYDANENRTSVEDANGKEVSYTYDQGNRHF